MKLEEIIESTSTVVENNKRLCIATGVYILSAIADSYLTINGINTGGVEGNPYAKLVMDYLGTEAGVVAIKGSLGIAAFSYSKYTEKNYLLYFGSVLSTFGAATWLLSS